MSAAESLEPSLPDTLESDRLPRSAEYQATADFIVDTLGATVARAYDAKDRGELHDDWYTTDVPYLEGAVTVSNPRGSVITARQHNDGKHIARVSYFSVLEIGDNKRLRYIEVGWDDVIRGAEDLLPLHEHRLMSPQAVEDDSATLLALSATITAAVAPPLV